MTLFCKPNALLNWRNEGGNFIMNAMVIHNSQHPCIGNEKGRGGVLLRRMRTDYLDSVIVHYVFGSFPVEETVGAFEKSGSVRERKIRTYGLSNSQPADLAAYQEAGGNVSVVQEFFSIFSLLPWQRIF